MRIRTPQAICSVLLLSLLLVVSAYAAEPTSITLEEALDLAFAHNSSHALFLWEQALAAKREATGKHPQLTARLEPVGIKDGSLEKPAGSLTMTMPLGENMDLRSSLTLGFDQSGMAVQPAASLNLAYAFFQVSEKAQVEPTPDETRRIQANSLVLETVDLLLQLRQQIDRRDYEADRLRFLEASLDAARITPDYDDLPLRQALRDQIAALAAAEDRLDQLQLRLGTSLGQVELVDYDPVLDVRDMSLELMEEELRLEVFTSSSTLRRAEGDLQRAYEELELERKTRGWDFKASGGVRLNEASSGWSWDLGLSATKTLYPRNILLEELELAAAKAEFALETQKNSLNAELREAIQSITAAQDQMDLKAEHLALSRDDLDLRRRQYEAGLVTALQVQEAELAVQKAQLDYAQGKMVYVQSVLALWTLCGRDVRTLVFELIG